MAGRMWLTAKAPPFVSCFASSRLKHLPTRGMQPRTFIEQLQALPDLQGVFNPWRDFDATCDIGPEAPEIRASNLELYLAARLGQARLLLVAEAPGFRGAKFSGIAMTSERILLGKQPAVPHEAVFDGEKCRTSSPSIYADGFIEPTASITWSLLLRLGLAPEEFVLWNAFPCHPHKSNQPLTNRAPTPRELVAAEHILPSMLELFPNAQVVAVGRVAQRTLRGLNYKVPNVRHPAMGGATKFRAEIQSLLAS